jgi:hypothetical protein
MLVSAMLVWRKLYREMPLFFSYTVSAWAIGILRYVTFPMGGSIYFYAYWVSELAGAVIVSLAIYEVFIRRLFRRFQKVRFYRGLFPIVAVLILFLTIMTALHADDRHAAFLRASRALDFGRTSVLVFFIALMAVMGREWTRYDFGIALGFGLQAAITLFSAAVHTQIQNPASLGLVDAISYISYNVACLIWLVTFWKPEKAYRPAAADDQVAEDTLHEARKWEEVLKSFLLPRKRLP